MSNVFDGFITFRTSVIGTLCNSNNMLSLSVVSLVTELLRKR